VDTNNVFDSIKELWLGYTAINYNNPKCLPTWGLYNKEVSCLLNQYPKEWLVNEIENDQLLKFDLADLRSVEPWWKLILGNKAILPVLWSLYPMHPNLLPAYMYPPHTIYWDTDYRCGKKTNEKFVNSRKWVAKPLYGREGSGIYFSKDYFNYKTFMKALKLDYYSP